MLEILTFRIFLENINLLTDYKYWEKVKRKTALGFFIFIVFIVLDIILIMRSRIKQVEVKEKEVKK